MMAIVVVFGVGLQGALWCVQCKRLVHGVGC